MATSTIRGVVERMGCNYWWRLESRNGKVFGVSEMMTRRSSVRRALSRIARGFGNVAAFGPLLKDGSQRVTFSRMD